MTNDSSHLKDGVTFFFFFSFAHILFAADFSVTNRDFEFCSGNGSLDAVSQQCGEPDIQDWGQAGSASQAAFEYLLRDDVRTAMNADIKFSSLSSHFAYNHDVVDTLPFLKKISSESTIGMYSVSVSHLNDVHFPLLTVSRALPTSSTCRSRTR